jgi:16S rRNA processing protein RimM
VIPVRGSDRIEIGGIARAHGIRGEIVAFLHDAESTILDGLEQIWVNGQRRVIASARPGPNGWLVKLADVPDRNAAEALRGAVLEVAREDIEVDEDEVILDDLIGCKVVRQGGAPWGEIVAIDVGVQDRLVIHDGEIERLLPLVDVFVIDIDLEAGVVTVDPPEGLPESPVEHRAPKR